MTSELLSDIPKHERVLVDVKEDGSAKTFIYRSPEENKKPASNRLVRWLKGRRRRQKPQNKRR